MSASYHPICKGAPYNRANYGRKFATPLPGECEAHDADSIPDHCRIEWTHGRRRCIFCYRTRSESQREDAMLQAQRAMYQQQQLQQQQQAYYYYRAR